MLKLPHIKYLSLFFPVFIILQSCNSTENTVEPPPILSNFFVIDYEPQWSPNGNQIAYIHLDTNPSKAGLYLIDSSGENNIHLYNSTNIHSPTWSPNEEYIAFSEGGQIKKLNINSGFVSELTSDGISHFVSWSKSREELIYEYKPLNSSEFFSIYMMDSSGNNKRQVFSDPFNGDIRMPIYMLNGESFLCQKFYNDGEGDPEISIYDLNTNKLEQITYNNSWDLYPYPYSNSEVIFTSQTDNGFKIYLASIQSNNVSTIFDRSAYSTSINQLGNLVYCYSEEGFGNLWLYNIYTKTHKQLSY